MDTIIHAAIEQICSNGTTGITLSTLWRRLHAPLSSAGLTLCPSIKRAVLLGISAVPGIKFKKSDGSEFDPKAKAVEECESLELIVFGDEKLRRCFVGLYDVKSSHITPTQQSVLERLALAREAGVTQNQLCKELGIPGNNFFYVVKRLESWGLIVRHSTIVRTKEAACDKEPKNSQPVRTNLIRLQRYAPSLNSQQRLEITKESNNLEDNHRDNVTEADAIVDECGQDDVLVNDFLPKLKAVCDRLEKAKGKVLVVADIKKELGYRETPGHRAWRNVCNKLKQAGLIELFDANVSSEVETPTTSNKKSSRQRKPVSCLKLLRKFSPKLFEHRTTDCEYDNLASDQHVASGKQVQNTDYLVELPIAHQIVDMIDAEGSKGLLGVEVCKRLGIRNKHFDNWINPLVSQFGLHQLSENHKRGVAYRFWTRGNFCPQLPNSLLSRLANGPADLRLTLSLTEEPPKGESPKTTTTLAQYLNSQSWINEDGVEKGVSDEELKHGPQVDGGAGEMVSDNVPHDMSITFPSEVNGAHSNSLVELPSSPVPKLLELQQGRLYPSLTSVTRLLRIREIVETEKIILKPELQHRLDIFEKDKQSKMARKTLNNCLRSLQHEGHCKLMEFNIPGVTNFGRPRVVPVVVHSSVKGSASELSEQVHDKTRLFQLRHRSSLSKLTKESPVPVLHGIERIQTNSTSDGFKLEAFRVNGFYLRKMVRAKLLHCFLWDYVNSSARCIDVPTSTKHVNSSNNPHGSCLLFSLDATIKAMPLELFLQVVGSPLQWKDLIEKSKSGLLMSDFPDEEYKSLVNIQASSRLSRLTGILSSLKLIRMVADESPKDAANSSHVTLVYALDLKPYIEEPSSVDPLSGCSGSIDLRPHFRHDFVLSTTEAVEKYWQTLENCYAAADPKAAQLAFPGSVAYKALRVYYDNRQKRLNKLQADLDGQVTDANIRNSRRRYLRKMKRLSEKISAKHNMANYLTDSLEVGEDGQEEQQESSLEHCDMPMLTQTRQSRFLWTEDADRKLITLYARQSVVQGSTFGTRWSMMSDLPANIDMCRRRLGTLRKDEKFWSSLLRLCELLSQRYAEYVGHEKNSMLDNNSEELTFPEKCWDDFEDSTLKVALDEVLMVQQMLKLDPNQKTKSFSQGPDEAIASTPCELENDDKHLKEVVYVDKEVHQSLAVSSAIELLKLDYLTNSKSLDMPDLLSETFRRYSQHDINSAIDYLCLKKIMIGSNLQYSLSQSFVSSLCLSKFPMNTGKRAARLATRIHENEKKLMEGVVNLPSDLHCGDIYQLMALVSFGELSISPVLPHEGIGEAEDFRSSKRKYDDYDYDNFGTSKKHRFHSLQDSETSTRREKGFPGISVSLRRTTILRSNAVEFCKDDDQNLVVSGNDHFSATLGQKSNSVKSSIYHFKEAPDFSTIAPSTTISGHSTWELMANYTTHNLSNHSDRVNSLVGPEIIKSTYINIHKAGDQGLSMAKVSECIGIKDTVMSEDVVDVLELFGYVVKVNGYNDVHVVDSLYRAKYFLTSKPTLSQDAETTLSVTLERMGDATKVVKEGIPHEPEVNCLNADDVHKVTILNLPGDSRQLPNAIQGHYNPEGCSETSTTLIGWSNKNQNSDAGSVYHPIFPWINRDGSIYGIVYSGLRRRILGIVTQKPGILEDGILGQMSMLTPQCCRKLLELMVLDKHLFLRKMCQRSSSTTIPALLESLTGNHFKKPKYVCREHYFVNPMSTPLL